MDQSSSLLPRRPGARAAGHARRAVVAVGVLPVRAPLPHGRDGVEAALRQPRLGGQVGEGRAEAELRLRRVHHRHQPVPVALHLQGDNSIDILGKSPNLSLIILI